MSNLVELMAAVSAKREELTSQVQAVLKEGLQQFMREQSEIKALVWVQYTPYFNDGEECTFAMHDIYYTVDPAVNLENIPRGAFYGDDDNWYPQYRKKTPLSKETADGFAALSKALHAAQDDLKLALGDHVQVIVTAEGIDVQEFEHD